MIETFGICWKRMSGNKQKRVVTAWTKDTVRGNWKSEFLQFLILLLSRNRFLFFELNSFQSFSLEKLSSNSVKLLMSLQKAPNEVIQSEFRLAESFLNDSWVVLQNYLIVSRGRMADSYWVPKIRNDFDSALLFELVC